MSDTDFERYPTETLGADDDDGTMPTNVDALAASVVGRRIVSAERREPTSSRWFRGYELVLTLDDGRQVILVDTEDCCAYTELEDFFLDPASVDHVILGVGTTDEYTTWHIYADFGDVMRLQVGWSPGNPFYYGYGFDIKVIDPEPAPAKVYATASSVGGGTDD